MMSHCTIIENWRSKADLDAHLKMPHLEPLMSRVDELLARPVEIQFYEMLSPLAARKALE